MLSSHGVFVSRWLGGLRQQQYFPESENRACASSTRSFQPGATSLIRAVVLLQRNTQAEQ